MKKTILFSAISTLLVSASAASAADYVIAISVDGMGSSYLQSLVTSGQAPNFLRLENEGAFTLNARNDYNYTITLPNHTGMVTSRPVIGDAQHPGHLWTNNTDPSPGQTIASNNGSYVASMFDVAHDNGLSTGVWASKSKFSLFNDSYSSTTGAADVTGVNNGKDKVDTSVINSDTAALTSAFVASMAANPTNLAFVHITDPDSAGHASGWGSTAYMNALKNADTYIGQIISMVENSPTLNGNTTIIITADHGGNGNDHSNNSDPLDYTIPFLVWGSDATTGNLYTMNADVRLDPATGRPMYSAALQPIRNSEVGNLALDLLGLGAIPGSSVNANQSLLVPEPASISGLAIGGLMLMARRRRTTVA